MQAERLRVVQSVTEALGKMPSLAEMKSTGVLEKFREQQDSLQELLNTIVDAQENLCTKVVDNLKSHPNVEFPFLVSFFLYVPTYCV